MKLSALHVALASVLVVLAVPEGFADVPGSKDHQLIKRYEGSTIVAYSQKAFDEYQLPVSAVTREGKPRVTALEGRVTRITYLVPVGRSTLEVTRNYEAALKSAGFATLFSGGHEALGGNFKQLYQGTNLPSFSSLNLSYLIETDDRYLAAKFSRPQGDVHVALYVAGIANTWGHFLYSDPPNRDKTAADGQVIVQLDIIEATAMDSNKVIVSADDMSTGIANAGSIALYGILFDTNSAVVKPESMPTLEEIAKMLKAQLSLRLLIVGHTDNVGTFEANMDLSQRRAAAVVQVLTSKLSVDARRLTPVGVSFASPVASNKSDEGRSKNRRVQLVENVSAAQAR